MSAAEAMLAGATYLVDRPADHRRARPARGGRRDRRPARRLAASPASAPYRTTPGPATWPTPVDDAMLAGYFAVMTKWPRRFCCQQLSLLSVQKGVSLPLLMTVMRSAATPRLTR